MIAAAGKLLELVLQGLLDYWQLVSGNALSTSILGGTLPMLAGLWCWRRYRLARKSRKKQRPTVSAGTFEGLEMESSPVQGRTLPVVSFFRGTADVLTRQDWTDVGFAVVMNGVIQPETALQWASLERARDVVGRKPSTAAQIAHGLTFPSVSAQFETIVAWPQPRYGDARLIFKCQVLVAASTPVESASEALRALRALGAGERLHIQQVEAAVASLLQQGLAARDGVPTWEQLLAGLSELRQQLQDYVRQELGLSVILAPIHATSQARSKELENLACLELKRVEDDLKEAIARLDVTEEQRKALQFAAVAVLQHDQQLAEAKRRIELARVSGINLPIEDWLQTEFGSLFPKDRAEVAFAIAAEHELKPKSDRRVEALSLVNRLMQTRAASLEIVVTPHQLDTDRISPGIHLRRALLGDTVEFHVRSAIKGALTLLVVDSNGDAKILIPNHDHDGLVEYGKWLRVPTAEAAGREAKFTIEGPPGRDLIVGLVVETGAIPLPSQPGPAIAYAEALIDQAQSTGGMLASGVLVLEIRDSKAPLAAGRSGATVPFRGSRSGQQTSGVTGH